MDNIDKYLSKWNIGGIDYIKMIEAHSKSRCFEVGAIEGKYLLKVTPYEYVDSVSKNISVCKSLNDYQVNLIAPITSIKGNDFELSGDSIIELYTFYEHPDLFSNDKYNSSLIDQLVKFSQIDISQKQYHSIHSSTFKSYLLKLSSAYNIHAKVEKILSYIESDLIPFLPYVEKSFMHGDLHPHNIFVDDTGELLFHDFEAAGTGEKLFDIAMLVGCLGITDISFLKSRMLLDLLHDYSKSVSVTKLSIETFYDLVILIRLRWLMVWFSHKDKEMVGVEIDYIQYIFDSKKELLAMWQNAFEVYQLPGKEKWIIADAVFDKSLLDLKNYIDNCASLSLTDIKNNLSCTDEELALAIRSLIVAYSKEDDIKSVVKMLDLNRELFIESGFKDEVLSEMVFSFANASLEFLKCGEHSAISFLVVQLDELSRLYSNSNIVVVKSYLLRNLSVLYGACGQIDKSFELVNRLRDLHEKNIDNPAITEEYSRVLSNAVVSARQFDIPDKDKEFMKILQELFDHHPDSLKIKSAYSVAQKAYR